MTGYCLRAGLTPSSVYRSYFSVKTAQTFTACFKHFLAEAAVTELLLPPALQLDLLQLLKITLQKRLQGRKASLPALSQNQDRMLSWNPEPPPAAGPYMKTG